MARGPSRPTTTARACRRYSDGGKCVTDLNVVVKWLWLENPDRVQLREVGDNGATRRARALGQHGLARPASLCAAARSAYAQATHWPVRRQALEIATAGMAVARTLARRHERYLVGINVPAMTPDVVDERSGQRLAGLLNVYDDRRVACAPDRSGSLSGVAAASRSSRRS